MPKSPSASKPENDKKKIIIAVCLMLVAEVIYAVIIVKHLTFMQECLTSEYYCQTYSLSQVLATKISQAASLLFSLVPFVLCMFALGSISKIKDQTVRRTLYIITGCLVLLPIILTIATNVALSNFTPDF